VAVSVVLLSLAGAGLARVGPFGALGAPATPWATAPHAPTATATPLAQVVLNAALTSPQSGWETDSECAFEPDGYHATAQPGYLAYCLLPLTYSNFRMLTHVHLPSGQLQADYVVLFRYTDSKNCDYVHLQFSVVPGAADNSIQAMWDVFSHVNGTSQVLGGSPPDASIPGTGDTSLEIYANGPSFTISVNGQPLGTFRDTSNVGGNIGLGSERGGAVYTSIKISTLVD
jgi:hypothetical protein